MSLSRTQLEQGYFQRLAAAGVVNGQPAPLSEQELDASLQAILAVAPTREHHWVFGYGSLIWNPLFEFDMKRLVTLHGWRRRFCLRTELSRGTREFPGLVLGLEPGGSCQGIAFRLAGPRLLDEMRLLWRREMVTQAYAPRWVRLYGNGETLQGLAFTMNRDYPSYVGGLGFEQTVDTLARACGPLGSCAEYLLKTHEALTSVGIRDRHVDALAAAVKARLDPQS